MDNSLEQVLARLRRQARELWPETPPVDFRLARHLARPYSNVYRLQLVANPVLSHAAPPRFIYVKIFSPGKKFQANPEKYLSRLATEFTAGQRLYAALGDEQEIAVIKPLVFYPEVLAMASEEAPGVTLADLIERDAKLWPAAPQIEQLAQHCRRAGHALAAMQKATAEASRFDPGEMLEYIDVRMQRLLQSEQTPFTKTDRQQIGKFLETAIPAIPTEQLGLCGTHGDYAPFNLLAAPEKITVADFTMFKIGSVYNDPAYFYHRLEGYLHKPIFRTPTIRRLQEAFLQGYAGARAECVTEEALFKIFWIKHVVNNYSAIMRQRIVMNGRQVSLPEQLFNRHVFRRYNRWLQEYCQ